jgi:hypothetical protein
MHIFTIKKRRRKKKETLLEFKQRDPPLPLTVIFVELKLLKFNNAKLPVIKRTPPVNPSTP